MTPMKFVRLAFVLFTGLLVFAAVPACAQSASVDDNAKFIAGIAPASGSPLMPLTKGDGWQQHAASLSKVFAVVEKSQLAPIRDWSKANLTSPRDTVLYMFSGPDFLYANAIFPNAKTYVLAGLEPVGQIPDVLALHRQGGLPGLGPLQHSMRTVLAVSFFITKDMSADLNSSALRGTLPILYVFMARSGKEVRSVELVDLDNDGRFVTDPSERTRSGARGVKVVFGNPGGPDQTLYYFTTNIANGSVQQSGFLRFLDTLGPADSLVKSASYLMHYPQFSQIRDYLLIKSATIVEDDSGIPVRFLDNARWDLHPFGHYASELKLFPGTYQPQLKALFDKKARKLAFGYGYRWRGSETNVLIAVKKPDALKADAAIARVSEAPSIKDPQPVAALHKKKEKGDSSLDAFLFFGSASAKSKPGDSQPVRVYRR